MKNLVLTGRYLLEIDAVTFNESFKKKALTVS